MTQTALMKAYHRNKTVGLACYGDNERLTVEGVKQFRDQVVIEVFEFPTYVAPLLVLIQGGKA